MIEVSKIGEYVFSMVAQKYGHLGIDLNKLEYSFDLAYIRGNSYLIFEDYFYDLPPKVQSFIKRLLIQDLKASE